jgi:ElaB/YqjD/DUF883 family membrane-anchored ribosome-binding protein
VEHVLFHTGKRTNLFSVRSFVMASTSTVKNKEVTSPEVATVADKAREVASSVGQISAKVASAIGEKADEATSSVGSGMKSLAGTIRDKAPNEGVMGKTSSAVANTLESSGKYLEAHGLSGMAEDVTKLIQRHPWPALLIAVGVGYLFARVTTRS